MLATWSMKDWETVPADRPRSSRRSHVLGEKRGRGRREGGEREEMEGRKREGAEGSRGEGRERRGGKGEERGK